MDGVKKMRPVFEKKNSVRDSADFELEVVEGAKHGFAVRGDPNKEQEAKQCQIAEGESSPLKLHESRLARPLPDTAPLHCV